MNESFDCVSCKTSLHGRRFIWVKDQQHCIPCHDKLFAKTCAKCGQLIGHNSTDLFYEDKHYHESCLCCFHCQCSLVDQAFCSHEGVLLCRDCLCSRSASQCQACHMPILPGTRRLEFEGTTWHEVCFACHSCEKPIGAQGFVPIQGRYYCTTCYKHRMSPRCSHCKEALADEGVIYQGEIWHRECLLCTACCASLVDQNFTSHRDRPYCLSCFCHLFCSRCEACHEPITGQEEVNYITFREQRWHQACFTCSVCATSLVGVGFFPTKNHILCCDCNRKP